MVLTTYRFQLNVPTHAELHGFAHDVNSLVATNNGLTISFDSEVRWCIAGDLQKMAVSHCTNTPHVWLIKRPRLRWS